MDWLGLATGQWPGAIARPPPDFSGFPGLLRLFRRNPAFGRGDESFMYEAKPFMPKPKSF